jgi:hypothetical protein
MIYLAVRLARNSKVTKSVLARESDQFWLHPSAPSEGEIEALLPEKEFDDNRVRWFRSPKIAYVLRDF